MVKSFLMNVSSVRALFRSVKFSHIKGVFKVDFVLSGLWLKCIYYFLVNYNKEDQKRLDAGKRTAVV